ncbi:MAG: alpha/beta fold hydrolase [Parachlamydiaceae bacterium]
MVFLPGSIYDASKPLNPLTPLQENSKAQEKNPASIIFQAQIPDSLRKARMQPTIRVAYNIISTIIFPIGLCRLLHRQLHKIAGKYIVVAQNIKDNEKISEGRANLLTHFQGTPLTLRTPDNVLIDAMHIPGRKDGENVPQNAPTVILLRGNKSCYEYSGLKYELGLKVTNGESAINMWCEHDNLRDFVDRGFNVLLFNYRGVGQSGGHASCDGLVLDAESTFQYVNKELGVPEEKILLYGHSLGGAIAAQVATMHDRVSVCNDRSFSSLGKAVHYVLSNSSSLAGIVVKALSFLGWDYDSVDAWNRIKGTKTIVYHPEDDEIVNEINLLKCLRENNIKTGSVVELNNYQSVLEELKEKENEAYLAIDTVREVTEIIFKESHNRKQLPEEMNATLKEFASGHSK